MSSLLTPVGALVRRGFPLALVALAGAGSLSLLGGTEAGGGCASALAAPGDDGIEARLDCRTACRATTGFRSVAARRSGRGLRLSFERGSQRPVRVDIYRLTRGRRVVPNRLVVSFRRRSRPFVWSGRVRGRPVRAGYYEARFRSGREVRRVAVLRRGGRFVRLPAFQRGGNCDGLSAVRLGGPAFGGKARQPLGIVYRLAQPGRVSVVVRRGRRTIKRFKARRQSPGKTYRLRLRTRVRGPVRVTLTARIGGRTVRSTLAARGL